MGVRKNAKFLSAPEREAFVHACVMMKADIVNPAAPAADHFSRWDQFVAIHRLIQNANTPSTTNVNFGHGGPGAYGFLSWHRYFLYLLEQQLQSYVPGVMLPYWDWSDPVGTIVVEDFLGPNGDPASSNQVRLGYFAAEAPGTGANTTPAPAWWPAALTGWNLHAAFGVWAGPLRRAIGAAASLPSALTLRSALDKSTYHNFQNAVESGSGTSPFHGLHNTLHGWFGGGGHMSSVVVSPFDPVFYLHHCNADRLWAMWQMDGHELDYPVSGGNPEHHLNDPMYPWVGALAGYSSNLSFAPIEMPDFSALGIITPADVLDHRALGYSYDTQAVIGIALDRTGSMMGLTPDPMTTPAPDVTKWEAAKRGVSAFLLDCETAYAGAETYVVSGVKTFRSFLGNDFAAVFAGTPYGLVKPGGAYGATTFDAAVAPMSPGGGTPLADALTDVHATIVSPPFGWTPADEQRYLALFTDGMLTSGSPLTSIADGSLVNTGVFAMGFGTGADVSYPTLDAIVAKGESTGTQQVFHGENAGAIDKFYSQALAAAIGFTPIVDPVFELHEGEHAHLEFAATSAEDVFFITAQGMDFDDEAWTFHLYAPDDEVAFASGAVPAHSHGAGVHGGGRRPLVTARRRNGRLSLFLRRDNADASAWVGTWSLLIAWRARAIDTMVMLDPGELLVPAAAGPVRGPRYARLLLKPARRRAARAIPSRPRHRLDVAPASTGSSGRSACSVVVNISGRTRLRMVLEAAAKGQEIGARVAADVLRGGVDRVRGFARLIAPARDLVSLMRRGVRDVPRAARLETGDGISFDTARVLARLETSDPKIAATRDEELALASHHDGRLHVHVANAIVPGAYHVGILLEGTYDPGIVAGAHGHDHQPTSGQSPERFVRLLSASAGVPAREEKPSPGRAARKTPRPRAARRKPQRSKARRPGRRRR